MDTNTTKSDLAIILLNYNGSDDTIECLQSIDRVKTDRTFRVYILDNGSKAESYSLLQSYCEERHDYWVVPYSAKLYFDPERNYLIRSAENYGFAKGNNVIVRQVMPFYKYVVLLNNDTVVDAYFVDKMLDFLQGNPYVKYASCRINNYYDRSLLWNCGGKLQWWGNKHYFTEKELRKKGRYVATSFISGCALFLDTAMLQSEGLLCEDFFHGEEDFNFCWRMHLKQIPGYCLNETLVYHKVSITSKKTGNKVGKVAGYYLNRIIDMHKFYPEIIWECWRRLLCLFVIADCLRKGLSLKDIQEIMKLINQYAYNTQLTFADCMTIKRF